MNEEKELPEGCGYMGNDFGGSYLDSQCFGGRLYDLDSGVPGYADGLSEEAEYMPCPQCNHRVWLEKRKEETIEEGYMAAEDGNGKGSADYLYCRLEYPGDKWILMGWWWRGWNQSMREKAECSGI
jgi:uncharacterized protein YbaR (Trm112 family)